MGVRRDPGESTGRTDGQGAPTAGTIDTGTVCRVYSRGRWRTGTTPRRSVRHLYPRPHPTPSIGRVPSSRETVRQVRSLSARVTARVNSSQAVETFTSSWSVTSNVRRLWSWRAGVRNPRRTSEAERRGYTRGLHRPVVVSGVRGFRRVAVPTRSPVSIPLDQRDVLVRSRNVDRWLDVDSSREHELNIIAELESGLLVGSGAD